MKINYDRIISLATDAKNKHLAAIEADRELLNAIKGNKKNRNKRDAALVWLNGKKVWFDKHNTKDPELAYINPDNGEHYFDHENALIVAEKQGKRLPDLDEMKFIASLPSKWDDARKGRWFTFDHVDGGTVDIFYPASGYRVQPSGAFLATGTNGYYWSCAPNGANAYYLFFSNTGVNPTSSSARAYGFSVRFVCDCE